MLHPLVCTPLSSNLPLLLCLVLPAGLLLAACSFLLLAVVLLLELQQSFVLRKRWLLRVPLLLVASSEIVKLR